MHARKAYLKGKVFLVIISYYQDKILFLIGLNPKENRTVPPLKHEWVIQLKKDFPHLEFTINGGFNTIEMI